MEELTPKMIDTIRDAAKELTAAKRRAFEAQLSLDYLGGDARLTETVFGWSRHTVARGLEDSLRISIDTKAILKLGELSRQDKARGKEAVKAQDKDMDVKEKLVPFGIMEIASCVMTIIFGTRA